LNRDRLDYREFNPITKNHVVLHMSHRIMAIGLFFTAAILTVYAVRRLPKGHWLGSFLIVWFSIICLQALLGAATVWSNKAADIATFHVVLGAVTLALGTLLSMIALRLAHPVPSHVSASVESFPELAAGSKRPASGMAHSLF
jgi:heme A synthase